MEIDEQLYIDAVREDASALEYIEHPSEAVQIAAIKEDINMARYIINPTEKVQFAIIEKDCFAIRYIYNPCEAVQLAAVESCASVIKYINNPTERVQLAYHNRFYTPAGFYVTSTASLYLEHLKDIQGPIKIWYHIEIEYLPPSLKVRYLYELKQRRIKEASLILLGYYKDPCCTLRSLHRDVVNYIISSLYNFFLKEMIKYHGVLHLWKMLLLRFNRRFLINFI